MFVECYGMASRKYTVEVLSPLVRESVSYAEVIRKLNLKQTGGTQTNIKRLIAAYGLDMGHFTGRLTNRGENHRGGPDKRTADNILVVRDPLAFPEKASLLKRALLEIGRQYFCGICGCSPVWRGNPLSLQIDHANGQKHDNRRENLRFTCPNCHSQTETFGRRKQIILRKR